MDPLLPLINLESCLFWTTSGMSGIVTFGLLLLTFAHFCSITRADRLRITTFVRNLTRGKGQPVRLVAANVDQARVFCAKVIKVTESSKSDGITRKCRNQAFSAGFHSLDVYRPGSPCSIQSLSVLHPRDPCQPGDPSRRTVTTLGPLPAKGRVTQAREVSLSPERYSCPVTSPRAACSRQCTVHQGSVRQGVPRVVYIGRVVHPGTHHLRKLCAVIF